MLKQLTLGMVFGLALSVASAQIPNKGLVLDKASTGPVKAVQLTSGTASASSLSTSSAARDQLTSAGRSGVLATRFSKTNFEKRWTAEKEMYEKAGISEDKIQKLHDIQSELWDSRARGEKLDFQKMARQRSEILGPEEMDKLRNVRREIIKKTLKSRIKKEERATKPQE